MDLPRGKRIISEKIANLGAVYKKLPENFRGVIRIFMKFESRVHRGDILIDDGNILGVSLDDLDKSISSYGEGALKEIKNKAPQSMGDVDVYKFGEIEMSLAIDSNERVLFRHAIPLDRLGVGEVVVEEERKEKEESKRKGEEERKEEGERKRKEEEERKRKEEGEKKRKEEEERKRKEEGEKKRKEEEERKRKEEGEKKRKEEEERRRRGEEERKEEEEKKRKEKESIEEWRKELGKLDEEWARLEDEWKKLESIKDLSVEQEAEKKVPEAEKKVEELTEEDLKVLKSKPKLLKSIGFTDKLRLLKFPRASNVMELMDGKKTVGEISEELDIDKGSIIDLMEELKTRGYIQ